MFTVFTGKLTVIGLSYEAEDVSSTGFFCPSFCYGYLGYGRRKRSGAVCPSYCYAVNMGRKKRGVAGTGSNQVPVQIKYYRNCTATIFVLLYILLLYSAVCHSVLNLGNFCFLQEIAKIQECFNSFTK